MAEVASSLDPLHDELHKMTDKLCEAKELVANLESKEDKKVIYNYKQSDQFINNSL